MNDTDAQLDIKAEYEECKKTARVYLKAVGVLEPSNISMPEFRESQAIKIENLLLYGEENAVDLPDDPDAREAAILAYRFLRGNQDPAILDTLLANESSPGYRLVLKILKNVQLEKGADMPDKLREWQPDSASGQSGRWRFERTRNYLIGMVVEALDMGTNTLSRWEKSDREAERLQREKDQLQADLKAISGLSIELLKEIWKRDGELPENLAEELLPSAYDKLSHELNRIPIEHFIERLNQMRARSWSKNEGAGLTAHDLVELTNQPSLKPAGIDAIEIDPEIEVRKHFPNLYATHSEATADKGDAYSICDAVASILFRPDKSKPEKQPPYRNVLRAWKHYRQIQ